MRISRKTTQKMRTTSTRMAATIQRMHRPSSSGEWDFFVHSSVDDGSVGGVGGAVGGRVCLVDGGVVGVVCVVVGGAVDGVTGGDVSIFVVNLPLVVLGLLFVVLGGLVGADVV